MQRPFKNALKEGRFRSMPNSHLPASLCSKRGVLLLGDALNMRHPLTGAGMTVALSDVLVWRNLLQSVPHLTDYDDITLRQKKFLRIRQWSHSFVVNVLAQALYKLFSASDGKSKANYGIPSAIVECSYVCATIHKFSELQFPWDIFFCCHVEGAHWCTRFGS